MDRLEELEQASKMSELQGKTRDGCKKNVFASGDICFLIDWLENSVKNEAVDNTIEGKERKLE